MESLKKPVAITLAVIILLMCLLSWYWSREPGFLVLDEAKEPIKGGRNVIGQARWLFK